MGKERLIVWAVIALAVGYVLYWLFSRTDGASSITGLFSGATPPDPSMPISSQSFPGVSTQKVYNLAYAISVAEGFWQAGSLPARANNPGDLELGNQGSGTINGKTVYADLPTGWEALYNEAWLMLSGQSDFYKPTETVAEIGNTYSGGDPNWAANVANALGVSTQSTLAEWLAT